VDTYISEEATEEQFDTLMNEMEEEIAQEEGLSSDG
jgi:hypothetical protein